jgi:hypothetical protein
LRGGQRSKNALVTSGKTMPIKSDTVFKPQTLPMLQPGTLMAVALKRRQLGATPVSLSLTSTRMRSLPTQLNTVTVP